MLLLFPDEMWSYNGRDFHHNSMAYSNLPHDLWLLQLLLWLLVCNCPCSLLYTPFCCLYHVPFLVEFIARVAISRAKAPSMRSNPGNNFNSASIDDAGGLHLEILQIWLRLHGLSALGWKRCKIYKTNKAVLHCH